MYRIGCGSDVHRLEMGLPLILGGVNIDSDLGAAGHSDADALLHAVTDAVLGALALGDIGSHFSDTDERWADADSFVFLRHAAGLVKEKSFFVTNVDSTVSLERPKLRPYIDKMRSNIAAALEISPDRVSVKAKTGEGVDAVGEGKAVRVDAVVLLRQIS